MVTSIESWDWPTIPFEGSGGARRTCSTLAPTGEPVQGRALHSSRRWAFALGEGEDDLVGRRALVGSASVIERCHRIAIRQTGSYVAVGERRGSRRRGPD